MIEIQYLLQVLLEKLRQAQMWAFWRLLPADVTSIQLYRGGPAVVTDELRLSTTPTTLYRPQP